MFAFESGRELAFPSCKVVLLLPMHAICDAQHSKNIVHPPVQIYRTLAIERGRLSKICGPEYFDDA